MNSKYEAVEHFRFMKKIYDKVKGSGFEGLDLCGVLVNDKYAYTTNNHIIGRVTINDGFPLSSPIFWSYSQEEDENISEINKEKLLLNVGKHIGNNSVLSELIKTNFTMKVNYFFSRFTENCFFFNKNELINFIENEYISQAKRAKISMNISTEYDNILIHCKPIKKSTSVGEAKGIIKMFCSPINQVKVRTDDTSVCSLNAFYVHEILTNSFDDYDIIGIKFRPNKDCPAILFGQDKKGQKPEIFWAIAQASIEK